MPFSIIFGAVAAPGAAYWAEVQGGLDAPFIATAICWFVGAVLVLFIPKPSKNVETSESKTDTINSNINTSGSEDIITESTAPQRESSISSSDRTQLSRLSERNRKHRNYMSKQD